MSFQEFAGYFTYISPIILSTGIIIGVLRFKGLDKIHQVLWAYLCFSLLIDISSRILGHLGQNNFFLFFAVGLLDILTFTYFYYRTVKKKNLVLLIGFLGIVFIGVELMQLNFNDVSSFQEYSNVVVSFSIITMSAIFLTESLTQTNDPTPQNISFLNVACLVFFAFQLIFLLPLNFLINSDLTQIFLIWVLRNIFLFSFYSILIVSIWKNGKIPN